MTQEKFSFLRTVLKALGLPEEAIDDILDRVFGWLSAKEDAGKPELEYPFHLRDDFISPAERNFYGVLKTAIGDQVAIFTKVNLADIFYVKSGDGGKWRTYTNKIDRKHIDFLLCEPNTLKPIAGIELDDKSHERPERQERDEFVKGVFAAAGLNLIRVPVGYSYNPEKLQKVFEKYLGSPDKLQTKEVVLQSQEPESPACPKCGSAMVLRTARSGSNQGSQFWGCSEYPKCKGITNYSAES